MGEVDLPTQLAVLVALLDDRLLQVVHQQRQVLQQLPGMKVLFHGHTRWPLKLFELGLQGGARLIQQEQDEVLENQLAPTGKVLRMLAVSIDEGGTIKRAG